MLRHVFFLSDLLPFDSILQVESSEGSDPDAFFREMAMEQNGSPLKRFACPSFENFGASQKLYMFLA